MVDPGAAVTRRVRVLRMALPGLRFRALAALGVFAIGAGLGGAALGFGLQVDLPDVKLLQDYTPQLTTRVMARDGTPLASFGEQKRILLAQGDIPKVFEQALIAVEDARFYKHAGVDLGSIARAAWHDLTTLSLQQGASTITQQLAKNLFLRPDKTLRRKAQEALLALEIERHYSKHEILRLYVNQVYMGHGRYGLEAASQFYFGKHARELQLGEAAVLAGLIQRPEGLSPIRYPDRAIRRRDHVLTRMVDEGFITDAQAAATRGEPILVQAGRDRADLAPYFVEHVRRWLQARYGDEALYQQGLQVRTTLDVRVQEIANVALDEGLRDLDKRQGWRGRAGVVPAGASPETWQPESWKTGVRAGEVADAVVVSTGSGWARVRVGAWRGSLDADAVRWTGRGNPATFLAAGDVVRVRVKGVTAEGNAAVALEQDPLVEAALVALDPVSGHVLALVGGFDFRRSEFDRAIQARRQAGSSFKPIVAAAALATGATPSMRVLDEPTVFVERGTWTTYQPENYGMTYYGEITLREALEKSANIANVKLLDQVGYTPVIDLARRLGIKSNLQPYPSMALGAFELSLLELTGAYAAFANQGVRVEPHLVTEVTDRSRRSLFLARPEIVEAVDPSVAYQMNRLLQGVITDGTGAAAAGLGRPLAGKTGTTDDFTDAWFVGYSPDFVVGVWVGFDAKKSLGSRETGARAALPIWQRLMEQALEGRPALDFAEPAGMIDIPVDRLTGLRASAAAGCASIVVEAFAPGTEPVAACTAEDHARLALPYPFHRYTLNEDGVLEIPSDDLDRLLAAERSVSSNERAGRLETTVGGRFVSLRVRRTPGGTQPVPEDVEGRLDPSKFIGRDGRPVRFRILSGG